MYFKLINGSLYEIVSDKLTLGTTFSDIKDLLISTHLAEAESGYEWDITFVINGHTIQHSSTIGQENLTLDSTVYLVARQTETKTTMPETAVQDIPEVETEAEAKATVAEPGLGLSMGQGNGYTYSYSGKEIQSAIDKCPTILFNIIQLISRQNPFFLSYLAVNPSLAQQHIKDTLDNEEFKLTIKGDDVSCDPIKPILMHPSGQNGYQVDTDNIKYILDQTDLVESETVLVKAKEIYLLHDRNVRKTIEALKNTDNILVM